MNDERRRRGEEVTIPVDLFRRIDARVARSEFETVDEYATYVLESVVSEVEAETDEDGTAVRADEVQARLKSLGYMD